MKTTISILIFLVSLSLFNFSCKKNSQTIPYVTIDTYLNINLPSYINLNGVGGWVYVSGGSKGLIVYRQSYNKFMVYDRHCTYNIETPCGEASVDSSNVGISCACDGSKYQLYDGAVINGPATFNLHQYSSDYNEANNSLHIYN